MRPRYSTIFSDRRGGTAVETAIIAPLLIVLFVTIVELGLARFTQAALDAAARGAARLVRTGQVQQGADPLAAFRGTLCDELRSLVACGSLIFDVRSFVSFAAVNLTLQTDASGNMTNAQFSPGKPGEVVAVRVSYNRSFSLPSLAAYLAGPRGSWLLLSTVVFRNEPFPVGS